VVCEWGYLGHSSAVLRWINYSGCGFLNGFISLHFISVHSPHPISLS
jgi:hypothetical protein